MKTRTLHKALSMLLTAAMVFNIGLTPVFASEGVTPPGVSGVYTHHTEHTEDCGYKQGTPCTHVHTEDCYKMELTCPITKGDTAGDAPEVATDSDADIDSNAVVDSGNGSAGVPHTHGEDCYTKTDNCKHEHNEACGYTPDSPCTFDPASCTECKPSDKPAEKVCTCAPVDSGEQIHGKGCPLYTTPALSEAVKALIALVDALPNADTITEETTLPTFEAAMAAYSALSAEEKATFEATAQYQKLVALRVLLLSNASLTAGAPHDIGTGSLTLTAEGCGEACGGHIVTGMSDYTVGNQIIVKSGIHNVTLDGMEIKSLHSTPIDIQTGSTLNLTLLGVNTLSNAGGQAIAVAKGSALTITETEKNTDSLGIWGSADTLLGGDGNIAIHGGYISAINGRNSSAISGNEITITGCSVYAETKGEQPAINGGSITISGNAFVYAINSERQNPVIVVNDDGTLTKDGGIIFENNSGVVYGGTLERDLKLYDDETLTIPEGKTLIVPADITLTNNGTIQNLGTLQNDGTINNHQAITGAGDITGGGTLSGTGTVQTKLTADMITLNGDSFAYTGSAFEPTVTVAIPWTGAAPFVKNTDFTVGYTANTVAGTATVTVTPKGSNLTGSPVSKTFTITQSDTAFTGGIKTYKDTNKQSAFTYGDTITVKVTVAATGTAPAPRSRAVPTANQMALFKGNVQLTDPQTVISGTELTFTIATTDKQLAIGENAITAKYVESTSMAGHEQTITVTLNKKPLTGGTISAGQSKPYDGNNRFSGIAATFAADNGVLGGDAVTATVGGTTSSSAVGTSLPLTVTSATLGAADAGFYLPPTALTTITGNVAITKAPLTVSGGTVTPKQYDGTATATVTNLIFNGLKNSESLSIGTDYIVGSPTYNDASVATGKTVTGTASLTTSARANNYSLTGTYSITGDINKAASTLTITGDPAKPYDGAAVSAPATAQTGHTGSASFEWYSGSTKLASAPKNAGSYTVKAILAPNATNEGVTATRDFVISKAPLAITGYTVENKNYDGKRDATVSAVAFSGLQNGESLTSGTDYTTTASFADQNANRGISVTGTVTLTNTATASNYSLTSNTLSGQTANIAATNPTYSVANQKITLNKTLTAIQASGAATGVNGESVAGTLTWAESSGGNALTNSYAFTGNAGDTKTLYWAFKPTSGNYKTLSGSTVFTLTNKKVPVLTVSNIVEIYNGKAITTVNGTAKEDSTTVAGTFAFDGAPTMKDADIYNVTVKFAPNDTESYEIATTSITVTINQATVGIALNLSKDRITAGEPLPTPSIAYSGLVSGESLIPATEPIFAGMPSGSTEGTYTITWSNKTTMQAEIEALPAYQNYTANYKDSVTLTIDKKSGGGTGGGSTGGGGGGSTGGSGGGSTGGSDNPTPPSENKPDTKPPVTEGTNAKINSDKDGNATAKADDKEIAKAIEKADKGNGIAITLNVKTMDDTKSLSVTLSAATMTALTNAKVAQFTINNGLTTITLDLTALNALKGGDVILSVSKVDVKTLSAETQNAIGNRPVFRFGVTVGGKAVSDFKGGRVGLQMPYTRTTTEQAGNLVGVYVDGSGKVTWLENSSYDSLTGTLLTSTTHFSVFGVGYKVTTAKFTDVGTHWAKNDIDFVVARGLFTGTSSTTFAPNTSMTRGMFVTALGRLAGVDTKKYSTTKFTDVAATAYYSPYVAWASANSIVTGTSDTTFSPDKAISRQEMAVMLVNYSKTIDYKLPSVHAEVSFVDAGSIASWAKNAVKQTQMTGILMGKSGNRFDPTATATRAEVSAMLRRYVELMVNTETAEGWAMNESGQWMYIEDGKRVTGKKTIDGKSHTFDLYGVTTALPPERKYLAYTVQAGDSFWSIARKYKVSMFDLAKVNGKTIFSVIYAGDELKIPQQ